MEIILQNIYVYLQVLFIDHISNVSNLTIYEFCVCALDKVTARHFQKPFIYVFVLMEGPTVLLQTARFMKTPNGRKQGKL